MPRADGADRQSPSMYSKMARSADRRVGIAVFFAEPEPHGFWPAKNTVAFPGKTPHRGLFRSGSVWNIPLLPKHTVLPSKPLVLAGKVQVFVRHAIGAAMRAHPFVQRRQANAKSAVTRLRVRPPVGASRTASARNSSVRFGPIARLLRCNDSHQRSGRKPRPRPHPRPCAAYPSPLLPAKPVSEETGSGVRP